MTAPNTAFRPPFESALSGSFGMGEPAPAAFGWSLGAGLERWAGFSFVTPWSDR